CFAGPETALTATANAQPALLATSAALLATLADGADFGAYTASRAQYVAGHSLGEYSALLAAGALDLATALQLVRRRGELMAEATQGAMAAVIGLEEAILEEACNEASTAAELVVIANYNAPGQLVISGAAAAVERAGTLARERGARRVLPLRVSAAFHSPLMGAAAAGLAPLLAAAEVTAAQVDVVANVTTDPIRSATDIRAELGAQVTAPVRWIASVQHMAAAGGGRFVEIGPGNVLTGLIRRIAPAAQVVNLPTLESVLAFAGQ
ncbi:MAG TPA: ACP S-malonyltransferase, partial [Roseiflexaceae bacterium]|nr:ACP S-malonyltransferase [Roseiflexaceae bacterium]